MTGHYANEYRAEVDGLRTIAVLSITCFHNGFEGFSGGYLGVDVFFVISGCLITAIVIHQVDTREFALLDFFESRIRRLIPPLYLLTLACISLAWILPAPIDMKDFSLSPVANRQNKII